MSECSRHWQYRNVVGKAPALPPLRKDYIWTIYSYGNRSGGEVVDRSGGEYKMNPKIIFSMNKLIDEINMRENSW